MIGAETGRSVAPVTLILSPPVLSRSHALPAPEGVLKGTLVIKAQVVGQIFEAQALLEDKLVSQTGCRLSLWAGSSPCPCATRLNRASVFQCIDAPGVGLLTAKNAQVLLYSFRIRH